MQEGFVVFPQYPSTVLAHHGKPMHHHGLSAAQDPPKASPIEFERKFLVNVPFHPALSIPW
jgi:hypothetical protein